MTCGIWGSLSDSKLILILLRCFSRPLATTLSPTKWEGGHMTRDSSSNSTQGCKPPSFTLTCWELTRKCSTIATRKRRPSQMSFTWLIRRSTSWETAQCWPWAWLPRESSGHTSMTKKAPLGLSPLISLSFVACTTEELAFLSRKKKVREKRKKWRKTHILE